MRLRHGTSRPVAVLVSATVMALIALMAPPPAIASPHFAFGRVGGANRFEVSARTAQLSFPMGTRSVVIANGLPGHWPDALTASYLAGTRPGGAPVLLVRQDTIPPAIVAELDRLRPRRAIVLGGPGAVAGSVLEDLRKRGLEVTRLGGSDRYETMTAVARAGRTVGTYRGKRTAILVSGEGFADALSAGPVAYARHFPIVLTRRARAPQEVAETFSELGIEQLIVLGGAHSIGAAVLAAVHGMGVRVAFRAAGADRSDTSRLLATFAVRHLDFSTQHLDVASGDPLLGGADALSAGPHSGEEAAPLLITNDTRTAGALQGYVAEHADTLRTGHVFGGPVALAPDVVGSLTGLAIGDPPDGPTQPPVDSGGGGTTGGGGSTGDSGDQVVPKPTTVVEGPDAAVSVAGDPSEEQTTVLAPGAKVPKVREVLVLPSSSSAPMGLLGRVMSVHDNGDGSSTVITTPATLDEAYSTFRVSFQIGDDPTAASPESAPHMRVAALAAVTETLAASPSFDAKSAMFECRPPSGQDQMGKFTIDAPVDLSAMQIRGSFEMGVPELSLYLIARPKFTLGFQFEGAAVCHLTEQEKGALTVKIPVPNAPGLFLTLNPVLRISANGSVHVAYDWTPLVGYSLYVKGSQVLTDAPTFATSTQFTASGQAHAEVFAGFGLGLSVAGRAGIAGDLGPDLTADVSLQSPATCLRVDAGIKVALQAWADVFVTNWSFKLTPGTFLQQTLYDQCRPEPLAITTSSLPGGEAKSGYDATLQAIGGVPPYRWSADGLPASLQLDPTTGALNGKPDEPGTFALRVTVTDDTGSSAQEQFRLEVAPAILAIETDSTSLPGAHLNKAYDAQLDASGGVGTLRWRVAAGSLPAGLALSDDGRIAGTPTEEGYFQFTAEVSDAAGSRATQTLNLSVTEAGPFQWDESVLSDHTSGYLHSLSCASTTFCMAFDDEGNAMTFDGEAWSPPQSTGLHGRAAVSCPSVSFCVAAQNDLAITFDGQGWSSPQNLDLSTNSYDSAVSCASSSFCVAVAGDTAALFDGSTWAAAESIDPGLDLASVSCVSVDFCAATDGRGGLMTFDGGNWSARTARPGLALTSVSCQSATFCVAIGPSNSAVFNGSGWTYVDAPFAGGTASVASVSCTSTTHCLAVSDLGGAIAFDGATWTQVPAVDTPGRPIAVSCATDVFCAAIDNFKDAAIFDGEGWAAPEVIAPHGSITSISCATDVFCAAVDDHGNLLTLDRGAWSYAAPAPLDVTGSETEPTSRAVFSNLGFVKVACVSPSFCVAATPRAIWEYDGATWSGPVVVLAGDYVNDLDCASSQMCVAVTIDGNALQFDGRSWSAPVPVDGETGDLVSVSCPSDTFCMAGDLDGAVVTYENGSWSAPRPTGLDEADHVSCTSTRFCMAASQYGGAVAFDGSSWSEPSPIPAWSDDLSCVRATFCIAQYGGQVRTWDGQTWSTSFDPLTSTELSVVRVEAASCATSTFCMIAASGWASPGATAQLAIVGTRP